MDEKSPFRPVMPETYDTERPWDVWPLPGLRAFGAGVIDPFGVPTALIDALGPSTPWYDPIETPRITGRLRELRAESPEMATAGSMLIPGLGLARAVGGMTAMELLEGAPLLAGLGYQIGSMLPRYSPFRAQGRYPPGGAY